MDVDELTIRETTQAAIGNHFVGVANIWDRDLPDDAGVIAPRLSAHVFVSEQTSSDSQRHTVTIGSTFAVGDAEYQLIDIDEGRGEPGSITVRRMK